MELDAKKVTKTKKTILSTKPILKRGDGINLSEIKFNLCGDPYSCDMANWIGSDIWFSLDFNRKQELKEQVKCLLSVK